MIPVYLSKKLSKIERKAKVEKKEPLDLGLGASGDVNRKFSHSHAISRVIDER